MNAAAVETVGDATEAIPDSAKGHKKQLTSAAAAAGKPASTKTKPKVPASTSKEQPAVVEDPPATPTNVVTDQQPQKKVKAPKTATPAATTSPAAAAAPESPRQSSSRAQTAESPPSTKKKTTTKKVAPPQEAAPPAEPPSPVAASPTAAQDESSSTAEDANFLYIQRVFGSDASKSLISRHEMDAAFPTVDDSRLNSRDNVKTLHVIDTSLPGDNETSSSGQDGDTPDEIMLRAGFLGQTKIVEEALRRGATLEYRDVSGRNILHYVVAAEVLSLVKRILKGMSRSSKEKAKSDKFKDSLNCVDNRGWTPLHIAVCKGFPSIVEVLVAYPECNTAITLKHSCRPNKGEQAESQAIHFACIRGDSATLTALLKASSTVKNAKDSKDRTGLHYACASRKCAIDMLQTLCTDITQESIADLIAKDTDGETPLSLAIGWGNAHLVEYILVEYVAPYIRNCQGDESGEEPVSLSTILLSRDANGLSGLDYANVRGHTESIASVNRLWPVIRHKERDPPTLAEALLARSPDSAEADWDASKESVSLDSLSAVTTILLRQSARGSFLELTSLEQVVFETICTVTGEEGDEVKGQVARAVQKVGAESALKLLDVTMHIEKIGGQMTSDGRRRRTAGGVFYQLVKEELKKRDPTAFREIWKYISAEQTERNKQRKKQGSITSRDQPTGRPKPTTQTSHESSLSSYLHSYSLEPEVIEQECAPPVAQPQPSGGRRTGPQSTRVAAPPTQVGRPGSPSPSAKVPSFATLTTQYQNHVRPAVRAGSREPPQSGPGALARTGQVPAGKRIEHSASPPPPQSRFAGSSVAQSRSAERLGGAPQNRLTANRSPVRATHASMEVPRFAAMTEAAAGRLVGTNRTPTVDSPNRGAQANRGGVNASTRMPPTKNAPTTTNTGRSPNYGATQSRSPPPSRDSVGSHSTGRQIAAAPNSPPQNRVVGAPAASRAPTSAKGAQSSRAAGAPPANTQYARRATKEEEETVDDEGEEEEEEEYEEEEEGTTSGLQPGGDVLDRDLSMTQKTNEEEEEEDYDIEEEGSFEMR